MLPQTLRRTNPLLQSSSHNLTMSKHQLASSTNTDTTVMSSFTSTNTNTSTMSSSTSTNTTTTAKASSSSTLLILFKLIEANDWRKINSMFLTDDVGRQHFKRLAALVAKSSSFNGMTLLHATSRFNPPSLLISKMIELCPEAPASRDCLGRCPLHVAAGTGASSNVIKVLVDAYPEACMIQDTDGRAPLHMACDSSTELFEESAYTRGKPCRRTIAILLKESLESATLEDEDGMSPIEYALFSEAELDTVRLVQKAACKFMKKRNSSDCAEGNLKRSTSCSSSSNSSINKEKTLEEEEETKAFPLIQQEVLWLLDQHDVAHV